MSNLGGWLNCLWEMYLGTGAHLYTTIGLKHGPIPDLKICVTMVTYAFLQAYVWTSSEFGLSRDGDDAEARLGALDSTTDLMGTNKLRSLGYYKENGGAKSICPSISSGKLHETLQVTSSSKSPHDFN